MYRSVAWEFVVKSHELDTHRGTTVGKPRGLSSPRNGPTVAVGARRRYQRLHRHAQSRHVPLKDIRDGNERGKETYPQRKLQFQSYISMYVVIHKHYFFKREISLKRLCNIRPLMVCQAC